MSQPHAPELDATANTAGSTTIDGLAACRELIRNGSHSFHMASWLLPRDIATPAIGLYAFCRIADDLIDADGAGDEAIADLYRRLDLIHEGTPCANPEDRALAEVVKHFEIPRALPAALIEGLAWDAQGRSYETLSELYDYAARVAGCVGVMMSLIMGSTDERAVARACDLGVAMQLTNIARDIGEDARMGRLYVPRQWFTECGLDAEQWLANPQPDPRIASMCKRLLSYADILYQRADAGLVLLPLRCRPAIRAARLIYSAIGDQIAEQAYDTVTQRAIVPRSRKARLLAKALISFPCRDTHERRDTLAWPPLAETRYLLQDVESTPYQPTVERLFALLGSRHSRQAMS